ncbi:MAG: TonB-dependent receptor [Sphingomonadales bacterium]|nr:TonB-dependent receptor [Sphingomonadales bacterium]
MAKIAKEARRPAKIACLFLLGCSTPALAQSADQPAAPQAGVADIVVTAQKRAERLQDVPISVSAISGDTLAKQHVAQLDDITSKVPNLQLIGTQGENAPIFALRGVSMSDYSLNQSGPVATYYDEVYKGNVAFLGVAMYDLERVEVLRGPQGTLYGKNTTGGAVNLISRRPELDKTDGYLNVGYGNYGRFDASGALNMPLSNTLAARVAFTVTRADGWFRNVLPGKANLDDIRQYAIRASLQWEPTAGISFLLRASTSYQDPHDYGIYSEIGPGGLGAGVYPPGQTYYRTGLSPREIAADYTPRRRALTDAVALTSNIDIGSGLSITSVTSWDKGISDAGEDTDGSPLKAIEIFYHDRATQFAEDLRLTSNWKGAFDFILGAYYNRESVYNYTPTRYYNDVDVNGDGVINYQDCAEGPPVACIVGNHFNQVKHSYALYTDMHYTVGGGFTLRGGLRYTHDTGAQTGLTSSAYGVDNVLVAELIPPMNLSYASNNVSGKIGVDYKVNADVMLYANYSRGYRAKAFNAQALFSPSEATIAKPETIDAFEVGAKTELFDRRVTFNTAAFYYGYHNQQFINVDSVASTQTLVNVDRSRIFGGEAELNARLSSAISLRAGMGLLSSKIIKGVLSGIDLHGNKLANAPSLTLNGGLDAMVFDDGATKFSIHPDVSYVSSQYFEVFNEPQLKQSGYAVLGGHIDFEHGPYSISLWAKNLANKFYFTSRIDLMGGFNFNYNHLGAPRTYGISAGFKF